MTNTDFTDSGVDGVIIEGTGSTILIDNSTITDCNNNGLYVAAYQNVTIRRNAVRRIGLLAGRGKSGDGQFTAIQSSAIQNTLIENNTIDSVGYNGISVQDKTTIRRNLISNFCITKSDGGGVYLHNGTELPMANIRIESNIIRNGIGTTSGLVADSFGGSGAHGIFLDDCVQGVDIIDNTIADCRGLGVLMHAVSRVNFMALRHFW